MLHARQLFSESAAACHCCVMSEWEVLLCSAQVTAALYLYNSLWPQNLPARESSVYVLCPIISMAARGQSFPAIPTELVAGLEPHFWR